MRLDMARWALAACATVLLSACAPPARAPGPEPRPVVELEPDAIAALAELLAMEDRRQLDLARVERHALHPQPFVRGRAALAIGRTGERAMPPLIRLLDDAVADVRADAAFALGLLADSTPGVVAALARLAHRPGGGEDVIEAVRALGRVRGAAALAALDRLIDAAPEAAADAPAQVVAEALLAIWTFPRHAATARRVAELSSDTAAVIRWPATYVLMRWGEPATVATLRARLTDPEPLVRALAARGLRAPLVDSADMRAAARADLLAALRDAHPHVRINAVRALGGYAEPGLAAPIATLLADPDGNVVLAAVEALGTIGPAAVPVLHDVARDPVARLALRAAALGPLLRHDAAAALPIAHALAEDDAWLTRLYAARALAAAGWDDAAPLLRRLARDADARVAGAAFSAIAARAPIAAHRALLTEGVAHRDPIVRSAAIAGLQRDLEPGDLALLLEAYDAAQDDTLTHAALAAVDALAALAERGVPVARSFFLRFARPPPSSVVHRRVVERLGQGSWPHWAPIATGRDAAWYEAIVRRYVAPALAGQPALQATISGPYGRITVELDGAAAPLTVHNFATLARQGFYDADPAARTGARWHRVVPNFVLQDGDPRGDGVGGPGYAIRDEINRLRYDRGTLGMALSGPDTGGSQWFIAHAPQPHLDGGYTVFGRVVSGMAIADQVLQDDAIDSIRIHYPTVRVERGDALRGREHP